MFLPTRVLLSKLFHHGVVYSSSSFTSCSPLRITINLLLVKALNMNSIPYQIDIGHAFSDAIRTYDDLYIYICIYTHGTICGSMITHDDGAALLFAPHPPLRHRWCYCCLAAHASWGFPFLQKRVWFWIKWNWK